MSDMDHDAESHTWVPRRTDSGEHLTHKTAIEASQEVA